MKRILFVTNKPSFYRVKFFFFFLKYVNLDVVFEIEKQKKDKLRDKNWFNNNFKNFNAIFLSKMLRFSENYYINFDLFKKVKLNQYDEIIIGQYSTLNSMMLIRKMNKIGKKFILSTDGGFAKDENKLFYNIRSYFIKSADKYFSNSKKADEFLEFYGAQKEKIYRYHFTSYTSNELTENAEMYFNHNNRNYNNKTILCVSNFEKRKNIEPLIDAWVNVKGNEKHTLKIIGSGPLKSKYIEQIKKLGAKNIEILDFVPQEQLRKIYLQANCLVLNSIKDVWGLTISEAMSYGLPIISTKMCLAGTELVVNGENGYLIDINQQQLENALENILNFTKEQEQEIEIKNIEKIKEYSIEQMVKDHLNVIDVN